MSKLKPYAHYLIIFGLAMLLMAIGQLGGGQIAWAAGAGFQTVPTRTPTPAPGDPGDNEQPSNDDQDNSTVGNTGEIIGAVTDLSTGNPGAGVIVRINEIEVRTDTQGKYSLSGLAGGEYIVLLILEGGAQPAQEAITIIVDGKSSTIVDLAYHSLPDLVEATATPTVILATDPLTATAKSAVGRPEHTPNPPPAILPEAGGTNNHWWLLSIGGILAILLGLKLNITQH